MSALTQRFDDLCRRLVRAAERSGRSGDSVRLVAVSKFQPALSVAELARHWAEQGQTPVFGESYVQEAAAKRLQVAELAPGLDAHWHFIGHLQSRKAKDVIDCFDLIHSVDSLKLAVALDKAWHNRQTDAGSHPQDILIQVNIGREPQKSGVVPEKLEELLAGILALPGLRPLGLMCLPPFAEEPEKARPWFIRLRDLRDEMQKVFGRPLPHLSMGMSGDFEAAVEEGATLVRVGTDIFGARR